MVWAYSAMRSAQHSRCSRSLGNGSTHATANLKRAVAPPQVSPIQRRSHVNRDARHHVPRLRAVEFGGGVDWLGGSVRQWLSNVNMLLSVKEIYTSLNKFPLAAIPFFILAGNSWKLAAFRDGWSISRSRSWVAYKAACQHLRAHLHDLRGGFRLSVATTFAIGSILVPRW